MDQEVARIRRSLKTPRAAAIAGIIFSLLLITSEVLVWPQFHPIPLRRRSRLSGTRRLSPFL
jgi:hypothetical protein